MTTQQLQDRLIRLLPSGHGHYKVTFNIRGKDRSCTTSNMSAIDKIESDDDRIERGRFYSSKKQALQALYNEVKRVNI